MRYLFTILTLLLINESISSQTVGLVLSGGGAKGLAHIGVIKALEENNIPINYIAGTSMGAIIGALYSMGYTTEEMIQLFKSKDFYNWSTGNIEENLVITTNVKFEDASILSFDLKIDSTKVKAVLPSHIVPTQQMDLAFLLLFASGTAQCKGNFDSLFIPFRCIASDIQNKTQVLFKNGDLGEAVRSSMTIPIYFKPLIVNGKMLFDGGIYNNFPWKELKNEFHPGFIIGSKVANNTKPPKEDDILLQLENMIVGQTEYDIKDTASIKIETNLKEIGILDFNRIDEIVNQGYENTLKIIDSIKLYVKDCETKEKIKDKRNDFKKKLPELKFKSVNLTGLNIKQDRFIRHQLTQRSKNLSQVNLKDEYYKIITDDYINRLYPKAKYDEHSKMYDLELNANLKRNVELGIGGNISSNSINQGFLSGSYYFFGNTANRIYANIYFGRLYSSVNLSYRIKFPWKKLFSIESSLIFNRFDYYRSSGELFFEDVKPTYLIKNEAFGNLNFTLPLNNNISLSNDFSLGALDNEYYQVDNFSHTDTPDKTYFDFINNSLKLEKKTLNKKQCPYRGRKMYIKFNYISGKEEHKPGTTSFDSLKTINYHSWINIKLYSETYHRILRDRIWLGVLIDANYSTMNLFSNSKATLLVTPSFNPTPHSKTIFISNFRSNKYLAIGIIPCIRLFNETFLRLEGYAYQPMKELNVSSEPNEENSKFLKSAKFICSASIVAHTRVGPLSISMNYYPEEEKKYYFVLSFGYILFNKKALE